MGGGGQGTQSTTNTAAYPEEFRPLATRAVNQITALQNQLPLKGFAAPNPGQTAGIAPFQQATMNLIPGLLTPSWGLQTLQNMGGGADAMMGNILGAGNPYNTALSALSSGGFGTGNPSFPQVAAPTQPNLNTPAAQPNVVGGGQDLVSQLMAQLYSPVPSNTPTLNAPITGPVPKK